MLYLYLGLSFGAAFLLSHKPIEVPLFFLGAFLALALLHVLVLAVASLFVNKKDPDPKRFPLYRKLLTLSIDPLLTLGGVQVKLVGADRLPEGGFLLVGNHRSDFDPITAMYALRDRGLTFVTKKENIDIPVGGRLIAGSGCISLDRSDDKQGLGPFSDPAGGPPHPGGGGHRHLPRGHPLEDRGAPAVSGGLFQGRPVGQMPPGGAQNEGHGGHRP